MTYRIDGGTVDLCGEVQNGLRLFFIDGIIREGLEGLDWRDRDRTVIAVDADDEG